MPIKGYTQRAVQAESYIEVSRRPHHRRSCKGGQQFARRGWEVGMMLRPTWEDKLPEIENIMENIGKYGKDGRQAPSPMGGQTA